MIKELSYRRITDKHLQEKLEQDWNPDTINPKIDDIEIKEGKK